MIRRVFLQLLASVPTGFVLGRMLSRSIRPSHPPLDQPWPIDTRDGFANCREYRHVQVFLDGKLIGACVAVSPKTGHALCYQMNEGFGTTTRVVTQPLPCSCLPGMHILDDGNQICLPYKMYCGNIEIRHMT